MLKISQKLINVEPEIPKNRPKLDQKKLTLKSPAMIDMTPAFSLQNGNEGGKFEFR